MWDEDYPRQMINEEYMNKLMMERIEEEKEDLLRHSD